jgi:hypothetical protein
MAVPPLLYFHKKSREQNTNIVNETCQLFPYSDFKQKDISIKTTSFTPPSVIKLHLLFASSNNKKTKPTQKIIFHQ